MEKKSLNKLIRLWNKILRVHYIFRLILLGALILMISYVIASIIIGILGS